MPLVIMTICVPIVTHNKFKKKTDKLSILVFKNLDLVLNFKKVHRLSMWFQNY